MKRNHSFLILMFLSFVVFGLKGYCAGEENAAPVETLTPAEIAVIETALKSGFNSLFNEGDLSAALQQFDLVMVLDDKNSWAYCGLGNISLKQGDFIKAKELFNKSIELNAQNSVSYDGLGNCFRQTGQRQEAEEYYNKAIDADDKDPWPHFHLGTFYSEDKNKEGALKQAEILAALDKGLENKLREQIVIDNP